MCRRIMHWVVLIPLCTPAYTGIRVQKLMQVDVVEPGQRIVASKADSRGNVVVSAVVGPPQYFSPARSDAFYDPLQFAGLIKKIDASGNEIFSRLLAGNGGALDLAIDVKGDIYAVGATLTPQWFPFTTTLPATSPLGFQPNGGGGGFLLKLRGVDGTIAYATQLNVVPSSMAVDSNGQVLITFRSSVLATTPGAYSSPAEGYYVARLSATGDQVIFVARHGGGAYVCTSGPTCKSAFTSPAQVVLDAKGNIWVAGTTNATDLPVTSNALKGTCGCSQQSGDGFLAEFSADGSRLLYSTYFGTSAASATASDGNDLINAAAIDSGGRIWIVGRTNGSDLPVTPNALQKLPTSGSGGYNGFIVQYDPASNTFLYATYFGGANVTQIQVAPDGTVFLGGNSDPIALPALAAGFRRGGNFIAAMDPRTYTLTDLTTMPNGSAGTGLTTTAAGSIIVTGESNVVAVLGMDNSGSPSIYGITNSAGSDVAGQVAPGELITVYGSNIGPATPVVADLSTGQTPTQLGGVQVLVNGGPVPILYAQSDQINAITPFGLGRGLANDAINPTLQVTVSNEGVSSNQATLRAIFQAPEVFKSMGSVAAALNQDGTVNSADNRAQAGTIVSVFGTGFFYDLGLPSPPDGSVFTGSIPSSVPQSVQVLYGGPLEVTYAGPAPDLVAGVLQVNFRLPRNLYLNSSTPSFQLSVNGWPSESFVIFVK